MDRSSIKQTLVTSNRRYIVRARHQLRRHGPAARRPVDDETPLDDEPVALKSDKDAVAYRLRINGATEAEIEFLLEGPEGVGRRVELNAMTSDQFIAFVERKLEEHGVAKVVPNTDFKLAGELYGVSSQRNLGYECAAGRVGASQSPRLSMCPPI